jgi:hypothetical protein
LSIRTDVDSFYAEKWSPNLLSYFLHPFGATWRQLGVDGSLAHRGEPVVGIVNEILDVVLTLSKSVLDVAKECLDLVAVSGDRQVLRPDEVTFEFPLHKIRPVVMDFWHESGVKFTEIGPLGERSIYLSLMSMYAVWLGIKTGPNLSGVLEAELEIIRTRDDFVNDILSQSLFGSRRYKVKPAMWLITKKTLLHRDRTKEEMYEDEMDETKTLRVQLYVEDQNGRRLDFHEVGSGISYVMPILVSLHGAKTSWVAQPELHLHPAAQCEMGDVFLRAYHRQHFSVVETHSEHLLLRVLKRIRQTTLEAEIDDDLKCLPEAVSVLYFDPKEDGSTEIRQIRVTRLGDFKDRWPNGFFEERAQELFDE